MVKVFTRRRVYDTVRLMAMFLLVWLAVSLGAAAGARAEYLGRLGGNPFAPDSTANPFSQIANPFSPKSPNNPFGPYGNEFSPYSPYNEFATDVPEVYGTADE